MLGASRDILETYSKQLVEIIKKSLNQKSEQH
jgi:hypothetical protein